MAEENAPECKTLDRCGPRCLLVSSSLSLIGREVPSSIGCVKCAIAVKDEHNCPIRLDVTRLHAADGLTRLLV